VPFLERGAFFPQAHGNQATKSQQRHHRTVVTGPLTLYTNAPYFKKAEQRAALVLG
jgi:hypothetical protein